MICVVILQASRRMAMADMANAPGLGAGMVEVRLDAFDQTPDPGDLVAVKRTPVLMSCRRPADGGRWKGSENDRLVMLRQAVLARPDYIELDPDAAAQVRPFPGVKRVVAYTQTTDPPDDLGPVLARLMAAKPDVIKLTCRADTLADTVALLRARASVPVPLVLTGLGAGAMTLALIGPKMGAPWAEAAAERGAEDYPGQPTVAMLREVYRLQDVKSGVPFVGVTGPPRLAAVTCGLLNAGLAHAGSKVRALPVPAEDNGQLLELLGVVRGEYAVLEGATKEGWGQLATADASAASPVDAADWLRRGSRGWEASNLLGPLFAEQLDETVNAWDPEHAGARRAVMLVGCGPTARMLGHFLRARGHALLWCDKLKGLSDGCARAFGGAKVLWEGVYTTGHDVLVYTGEQTAPDGMRLTFNPSYLKRGMTVADLSDLTGRTPVLKQAEGGMCHVVNPWKLLRARTHEQVRRISGADTPPEVFDEFLAKWRDVL